MAYTGNDSDEYLPDSDDSNDEEERPNRWTGPPSTWQQLNRAEIDTLTALNEIRNRDLSVHLYNAFALKHRHNRGKSRDVTRPAPNQDVDIATGQLVREDKWVPPNSWTAWPLPANAVPRPDFMGRTDGADERFTYRMQTPYRPKTELEETISATMLRLAKERFQARQRAAQRHEDTVGSGPASSDEEGSDMEMSSKPSRARSKSRAKSSSKSRPVQYESTSEGEMMDIDDPHAETPPSSILPEIFPLKTVAATDDELSYTLLRPSVRGILEKLDTTLTVLHHAQESKISCPSESDASNASSRSQSCSCSRSRAPSRTHSQPPDAKRRRNPNTRAPSTARESTHSEGSVNVKKRGRPKRIYPQLDGETDKEYAIRIARLRKKPLPSFVDDDAEPISDSTPVPNSAAEYTDTNPGAKSRTRRSGPQSRPRRRGLEARSDITSASESSAPLRRQPRLARVRLRDWRDILGAAALAGFPAPALDRAARRCADLFGQSFTLHTLHEGPPEQKHLDQHVRYDPGMPIPRLPEDSEDSDEAPSGVRTRTSRAPSAAPSEGEGRGRSGSAAPRSSRSRSRSASAGGLHFCIFSNCPRAVAPFARRMNLMRHLRLVHKFDNDKLELAADVDSQDEMHGAVHVNGFLKPIRIRPGWRGDDAAKEKRGPRRRGGETMEDTTGRDESS